MLFCFEAELRYKSAFVFILSENLALAFGDLTIIKKKLYEILSIGRVTQLQDPLTLLLIFLLINQDLKHDRD